MRTSGKDIINQLTAMFISSENVTRDDVIDYFKKIGEQETRTVNYVISNLPPIAIVKGIDEDVVRFYLSKQVQEQGGREKDPLEDLEKALELLEGKFYKYLDHGRLFLYRVVDEDRQILEPIPGKTTQFHEALRRGLRQEGIKKGKGFTQRDANEMAGQWLDAEACFLDEKPKPMLPKGVEGWCFHRPEFEPEPGPLPHFMKILNRMDDPEAFAAWIWGVYSNQYGGRQILWLYGPHGEDGKSVLLSFLGKELFGPALGSIDNNHLKAKSGFLCSFFVGKQLVIYPDCKNKQALMKESFQSISSAGADPVLIEPKGEQAYTDFLEARAVIASNYLPEITGDNFSTSRLLIVSIKRSEERKTAAKDFLVPLKKELPQFLYYAKNAYEKVCENNYKIKMNDKATGIMAQVIKDFDEEFDYYFSKFFLRNPNGVVSGRDFYRIVKEGLKLDNRRISNFKEYLIRNHSVKIQHTNKGMRYYGLSIIGKTSNSIDEDSSRTSENTDKDSHHISGNTNIDTNKTSNSIDEDRSRISGNTNIVSVEIDQDSSRISGNTNKDLYSNPDEQNIKESVKKSQELFDNTQETGKLTQEIANGVK